jgi:serine/threonine-protein kinase
LEGKTLAERFRVDSKLGSGGYGAVFEAVQLSVGRRCALKVLFPHLCDDEATVQRFRTEARTTSRLTHPNSVIIYDFGRDEELGLLFLAMELLDGDDLRSVISKRGWLGVDETIHVVSQAAQSLQEAHDLGLVHRDIKPHNIMLLERGSDASFVKVIDFGIAKVVRNSLMTVSDVTQTGTIIGTPKYMSPEQIRDSTLDGRTDMYGLAISAYQMLIGRTPFEEGTALEIAARQIAEAPQPLRSFRPDLRVSAAFEKVLLKALEKKAEDRFDTVADFARALADAAKPARATPPMATPRQAPEQVRGPCELTPAPEGESTALIDIDTSGSQARRVAVGLVQSYDEITQRTDALVYDGKAAPQVAQKDRVPDDSAELLSEDRTNSIELAVDGAKTMATLAIANPARPEYETERTREGTTAVVAAQQQGAKDAAQSDVPDHSGLSRVPIAISAVLVVLVGVGFWALKSDFGDPTATAAPESSQGSVTANESALTVSVQAEQSPEPESKPKAEPDVAPEAEVKAEVEPAVQPQAEPAENPEPELKKEPEAAPRPRKGTLEVRVIPWGTLYVDGRKIGEGTRHRLRLAVGRHRLVLKQSGEVRARRSVDVSARSSKIIELVAK